MMNLLETDLNLFVTTKEYHFIRINQQWYVSYITLNPDYTKWVKVVGENVPKALNELPGRKQIKECTPEQIQELVTEKLRGNISFDT